MNIVFENTVILKYILVIITGSELNLMTTIKIKNQMMHQNAVQM